MTGKMTVLTLGLLTALRAGSASADELETARQARDAPVETSMGGIYKSCIGDQWYLVTYEGGIPTGITPKLKGGKPELCAEPKLTPPLTNRALGHEG